jgi:hypothetical protein
MRAFRGSSPCRGGREGESDARETKNLARKATATHCPIDEAYATGARSIRSRRQYFPVTSATSKDTAMATGAAGAGQDHRQLAAAVCGFSVPDDGEESPMAGARRGGTLEANVTVLER